MFFFMFRFLGLMIKLKCKYSADKLIRIKKSDHCGRLMKISESNQFFAFKIRVQI